jgi:predicted ATPase
MELLIPLIKFNFDFRCYKEGDEIKIQDRMTVITGDNGAGKSSLVSCIRKLFNTEWTRSDNALAEGAINEKFNKEVRCEYIDVALDHLSTAPNICTDVSLQMDIMKKSSGQGTVAQVMAGLNKKGVDVFIIDEPERGLSDSNQALMTSIISHFFKVNTNAQFFVISHSEEIIKGLTDRVLVLPEAKYTKLEEYLSLQEFYKKVKVRNFESRVAEFS